MLSTACTERPQAENLLPPSEYVTTLMGTQSDYALSTGNTYPAIALPWGMNFWTPQTGKMGDGWTYTYGAHTLRGLKQTHQPSPMDQRLRPVFGDARARERQAGRGVAAELVLAPVGDG
ncbi:alpha-1,2-mannosidase, partial [human gut metagenome]